MSLAQVSPITIHSLPQPVLEEIFSYTLLGTNIAPVCSLFNNCVSLMQTRKGIEFARKVDLSLWTKDVLPNPDAPISDEIGRKIFQRVMIASKHMIAIQESYNSEHETRDRFPKFSLKILYDTPLLLTTLVQNDAKVLVSLRDSLTYLVGTLNDDNILTTNGGPYYSYVPESIGKCPPLTQIFIASRQLKSLPESIGSHTELKKLHASQNKIRALPESIVRCMFLEELFLDYNELQSLPSMLVRLPLRICYVNGNPDLPNDPESVHILYVLRKNGCDVNCDFLMEEKLQSLQHPGILWKTLRKIRQVTMQLTSWLHLI